MSGGYYSYAYNRVHMMADQVQAESSKTTEYDEISRQDLPVDRHPDIIADRLAIAEILRVSADAMRELEYFDSGDISDWDRVRKAFGLR